MDDAETSEQRWVVYKMLHKSLKLFHLFHLFKGRKMMSGQITVGSKREVKCLSKQPNALFTVSAHNLAFTATKAHTDYLYNQQQEVKKNCESGHRHTHLHRNLEIYSYIDICHHSIKVIWHIHVSHLWKCNCKSNLVQITIKIWTTMAE